MISESLTLTFFTAIIASLQFASIPEMTSWFLTLVVLCLPLSSLWASASLDGSKSNVSSRANVGEYNSSSRSNDKSIATQKSAGNFGGPSTSLNTNITADQDIETAAPHGIVSEKTWNVSRSDA
jgi:hypothetical protein